MTKTPENQIGNDNGQEFANHSDERSDELIGAGMFGLTESKTPTENLDESGMRAAEQLLIAAQKLESFLAGLSTNLH